MFCETHQCEISESGCVARQKRAKMGSKGWDWRSNRNRVPFDPSCEQCEQGEKVMEAMKEKGDWSEAVKEMEKNGDRLAAMKEMKEKESEAAPETVEKKPEPANDNGIPYGYCHCGCGQKTTISHVTDTKKGYVKGEPRKYLLGHVFMGKSRPAKPKTQPVGTKKRRGSDKEVAKTLAMAAISYLPTQKLNGLAEKLLQLPDGKELLAALEKLAEEQLRSVENQACWELVKVLRDSSVAALPQNDKSAALHQNDKLFSGSGDKQSCWDSSVASLPQNDKSGELPQNDRL